MVPCMARTWKLFPTSKIDEGKVRAPKCVKATQDIFLYCASHDIRLSSPPLGCRVDSIPKQIPFPKLSMGTASCSSLLRLPSCLRHGGQSLWTSLPAIARISSLATILATSPQALLLGSMPSANLGVQLPPRNHRGPSLLSLF
jgi:hypothetical protein